MAIVYKKRTSDTPVDLPPVKAPDAAPPHKTTASDTLLPKKAKLRKMLPFSLPVVILTALLIPGIRENILPPAIQDTGMIICGHGALGGCVVANTTESFTLLADATRPPEVAFTYIPPPRIDRIILQELLTSERVFIVHQRTKVNKIGEDGNRTRVQILEGVHAGKRGWIEQSAFSHEEEKRKFTPVHRPKTGDPKTDEANYAADAAFSN